MRGKVLCRFCRVLTNASVCMACWRRLSPYIRTNIMRSRSRTATHPGDAHAKRCLDAAWRDARRFLALPVSEVVDDGG